MAFHLIVVEAFDSKPPISWWCQGKSKGMTKVIRIHPPGIWNVCIELHGKPSNSLRDISAWTTYIAIVTKNNSRYSDYSD